MEGWIKSYRKAFDNPLMKRPLFFITWFYILHHVAYKPTEAIFKGKRITLKPGQGIFSCAEIAKYFGVKPEGVRKTITRMKQAEQLDEQGSPQGTLITVLNWGLYQSQDEPEDELRTNAGRTQDELRTNLPIIEELKNIRNKEYPLNPPKPEPDIDRPVHKPKRTGEVEYADFVRMLPTEHDKLVMDLGKEDADRCITILNDYKGSTGKQYDNDYYAIRSWVVRRLREDKGKKKPGYDPFARNDTEAGVEGALKILGLKGG